MKLKVSVPESVEEVFAGVTSLVHAARAVVEGGTRAVRTAKRAYAKAEKAVGDARDTFDSAGAVARSGVDCARGLGADLGASEAEVDLGTGTVDVDIGRRRRKQPKGTKR